MRRYAPMRHSSGTQIPLAIRRHVLDRDRGCVGPRAGMEPPCQGSLELDHVRASGGIGMKSPSTSGNLLTLCGSHHRTKTDAGRLWRPKLLVYLASVEPTEPVA